MMLDRVEFDLSRADDDDSTPWNELGDTQSGNCYSIIYDRSQWGVLECVVPRSWYRYDRLAVENGVDDFAGVFALQNEPEVLFHR